MNEQLRRKVIKRSRGMCEMMIDYGTGLGAHRCNNVASDIHHMLTKGRGGAALDRVHETYHLLHLCRSCHQASDGAEAYEGGFLIEGSAIWDTLHQRPRYTGPDEYLTKEYG
jgi:hypothetical protein